MTQFEMADKVLEVLRQEGATAANGKTFASREMRQRLGLQTGPHTDDIRDRDYSAVLAHLKDQGLIQITGAFPLQLQLR